MSVFKKRTRMVSFRVSPEEYEELLSTSMAHGARSVSDFASVVTLQSSNCNWEAAQAELKELNGRVNELDSQLKHLAQKAMAAGSE